MKFINLKQINSINSPIIPAINKKEVSLEIKKIMILFGPTGTDKTSLSLLISRSLNAEIISSNSMQIYIIEPCKHYKIKESVLSMGLKRKLGIYKIFMLT